MKKLKGKNLFTQKEIDELKQLITHRINSTNKNDKKNLRKEMRKIGFYGRDDWGIVDCRVSDLENLLKSGEIKVTDAPNTYSLPLASRVKKFSENEAVICDFVSIEKILINGDFKSVSSLTEDKIADKPGIYCIKLREGSILPSKYGKIRKDRIIYIGIATKSLRKRLWQQELNHEQAATFFRSIGAILGYLPPKGSLYGKKTRNYKFSPEDTDKIRKWMRQSLRINYLLLEETELEKTEDILIKKYTPLVNIKKNPNASEELIKVRQYCVDYAKEPIIV